MADPFDSAWLKWGQAVVHAQTLQDQLGIELQRFQSGNAHTTATEYDAKRHAVVLRLVSIDPIPDRIGLLLGDAANNFRASLDHLAWALVTMRPKRPLTDGDKRNVYFPMCKTPTDFDNHLVPGQLLQDPDRKIIRRFQPFWNTPTYRLNAKTKIHRHCLSVLPDINRDDKHKTLRAVWLWPQNAVILVGEPVVDCILTKPGPTRRRSFALEPGVEISRAYVRKTGPNPDVYMHAQLTAEPTFDGRVTLDSWLAQVTRLGYALLARFAEPPKKLGSLGIAVGKPPLPPHFSPSKG